jgi:hypothetical protein
MDLAAVRLFDSTRRSGETATWKRPAKGESFDGNMGSIQLEDSAFYAKEKNRQPWEWDSNE